MPNVASNSLNNLEYSNRQGYSKFDLSQNVFTTMRFSELTPIYLERSVLGDKFTLKVSQNIQNYVTLKSPLMGQLRYHNDFFAVPRQAMLPHTYELLFTNPNRGDDVPDDAYPFFDLRGLCNVILSCFNRNLNSGKLSTGQFYCLNLLYQICGYGTLPDYLNDRSSAFCSSDSSEQNRLKNDDSTFSFGPYLDNVFSTIFAASENSSRFCFLFDSEGNVIETFNIHGPEDVRYMFNRIAVIDKEWYLSDTNLLYTDFIGLDNFVARFKVNSSYGVDDILPYVAYQMVASQFYTIDTVDDVWNYKVWMLNMEALANMISQDVEGIQTYPQYFKYNGTHIQYDLFSNHTLTLISDRFPVHINIAQDNTYSEQAFYHYAFYMNLFAPATCLRYRDYFVGSRTQPLAVGDVTSPVVGDMVIAIDVTRSISKQRFLNAVNRTRRDLTDYAKSIFGVDIPRDTNAPFVLASEVVPISDSVNINTAESQGDRKANIVSTSSNFAYETEMNQECYILGLGHFDFLPVYPYTTDRHNFHKDRFDYFQPMLQDIGDQPVYRAELKSVDFAGAAEPYSYQYQDSEYKFKVSTAHGGFIRALPSWAFVDYSSWYQKELNSEFIRLYQWWFDKYYSGLSNVSKEKYFHFMLSINVTCYGLRKMQFKPGILNQ